MREIQDMTLNVSRGLERLDKKFVERSERFRQNCGSGFGIRLTAIPIGDEIRIDRVFQQGSINDDFSIQWHRVGRQCSHDALKWLFSPLVDPSSSWWQPILRGARAEMSIKANEHRHIGYFELHSDGLAELGVNHHRSSSFVDQYQSFFSPDWLVVMAANVVVWATHVRQRADVPTMEYALEAEIHIEDRTGLTIKAEASVRHGFFVTLQSCTFPRYLLNDADETSRLLALVERDCWNAIGNDISAEEQGTLVIE